MTKFYNDKINPFVLDFILFAGTENAGKGQFIQRNKDKRKIFENMGSIR